MLLLNTDDINIPFVLDDIDDQLDLADEPYRGKPCQTTCHPPLRFREKSILLGNDWAVRKAVSVAGFFNGAVTIPLFLINTFIFSISFYRLCLANRDGWEGVTDIFTSASEKGLENFVKGLATLPSGALKLLLVLPLLLGTAMGLMKMVTYRRLNYALFMAIHQKTRQQLKQSGWRNLLQELPIPFLQDYVSLGARLHYLENSLLWTGDLQRYERLVIFRLLFIMAKRGPKLVRFAALNSLTSIVQSIALTDLVRLAKQNLAGLAR